MAATAGAGRVARAAAALLAGTLLALGVPANPARADAPRGVPRREVTVMTRNLYLGADLQPLFRARGPAELVQAAAAAYRHVLRTSFPERARAIAGEVKATRPDLVGLQEVALWKAGPRNALQPTVDYLAILLDALRDAGLSYVAVAGDVDATGTLPISPDLRTWGSFTDRDVVLARADLPASRLKTSHPTGQNYTRRLEIRNPAAQVSFTVLRGWSTVDVKVRGTPFRFADTHLEAYSDPRVDTIRLDQARELATALSASPYPVVLAGDLNSLPDPPVDAYGVLTSAGFRDVWSRVGRGPGYTAASPPADDLTYDAGQIDHRVDYVLYRGCGLTPVSAEVVGDRPADRTPSGRWPSDHAGVVATVRLAAP